MMNRKLAWIGALALLVSFGNVWADEHVDEEDVNESAEFGLRTSDEARSGDLDGLTKAGEALELYGGDNTDQAEATINTIGDADANTPDAVTTDIPDAEDLPDEAGFGRSTALDARDGGVDGRSIAEQAMDLADDMADEALEGREAPGRSEDLPDVPGVPDAAPEDIPGPPGG